MKLIYRMNTKDDEEALVKLWCEHGGWDQIDAETWSNRFMKSPSGPASIALAVDQATDEIVGQFAFIPSTISISGREVNALRPFAPIMSKNTRGLLGKGHPIVSMYWHGIESLKAQGDGLIYMVPDPRWLRFFRMFPFLQCGSFPLWSLPLPLTGPFSLGSSYSVNYLEAWNIEIDALWEKFSLLHRCSVVRNSQTLPWKIGNGDYTILVIRQEEKLVGLIASKKWGDRQWLICDLLVDDTNKSLYATLVAVTNFANSQSISATPDSPISKVAILATPPMENILRKIGFSRDAYDFPIVVHCLDDSIAKEDIALVNWYVSAND